MSATNHTTNLKLPLFIDTDVPGWLTDWNEAMQKIDEKYGDLDPSGDLSNYQEKLQSGVNIVTIGGESLLNSGNIPVATINNNNIFNSDANIEVQNKLVFTGVGQNVKTVGGTPLNGVGDVPVQKPITNNGSTTPVGGLQPTLATINGISLLTDGEAPSTDLKLQTQLTSGVNIKSVNNQSLLGGGNLSISATPEASLSNYTEVSITDGEWQECTNIPIVINKDLSNTIFKIYAWIDGNTGGTDLTFKAGGKYKPTQGTNYQYTLIKQKLPIEYTQSPADTSSTNGRGSALFTTEIPGYIVEQAKSGTSGVPIDTFGFGFTNNGTNSVVVRSLIIQTEFTTNSDSNA